MVSPAAGKPSGAPSATRRVPACPASGRRASGAGVPGRLLRPRSSMMGGSPDGSGEKPRPQPQRVSQGPTLRGQRVQRRQDMLPPPGRDRIPPAAGQGGLGRGGERLGVLILDPRLGPYIDQSASSSRGTAGTCPNVSATVSVAGLAGDRASPIRRCSAPGYSTRGGDGRASSPRSHPAVSASTGSAASW